MTQHLSTETQGATRILRFNRPDRKNAVTQAMYGALREQLDLARDDAAVRVVLLTGTPGCFSSGNDVADFLSAPPMSGPDNPVLRYMQALADFPKPVVAAIAGPCIGVAATTLLHCDLVLAAQTTRLQFPFVKLGICLEFASSLLMPQLMGHARASELLLLGEPFGSEKAREVGLVNEVVPDEQLEAQALALCAKLAALPPQALRTSKALLKRPQREAVQQTLLAEGAALQKLLSGPEAAEAIGAFLQKRAPVFR